MQFGIVRGENKSWSVRCALRQQTCHKIVEGFVAHAEAKPRWSLQSWAIPFGKRIALE
jgi:hypothetical protein